MMVRPVIFHLDRAVNKTLSSLFVAVKRCFLLGTLAECDDGGVYRVFPLQRLAGGRIPLKPVSLVP
jgi:hypothetical protein